MTQTKQVYFSDHFNKNLPVCPTNGFIFSFCNIKFYSNQSGAARPAWAVRELNIYLLWLVLLLPEEGSNINVLLKYSANQNDYFTVVVTSQFSSGGQWSTIHTTQNSAVQYQHANNSICNFALSILELTCSACCVVDVLSQFSWLRDDPGPGYSDYVANHAPSIPCVQSSDLTLSHQVSPGLTSSHYTLWLPPTASTDTEHKAGTASSSTTDIFIYLDQQRQ